MPEEELRVAARIRRLAEFLTASDAVRVRVERKDEEVEVARRPRHAAGPGPVAAAPVEPAPLRLDTIAADIVGIFRLSRPAPVEGERLAADREVGYIEALGIRNPVHSLGSGRIVAIVADDGAPVEYGQPLFLLDRG